MIRHARTITTTGAQVRAVLVEQVGEVMQISINRPGKRNAVNTATAGELLAAFEQFDANPSAKVAILRGTGGTFCAGYDLGEVAAGAAPVFADVGHGPGPMGPSRMRLKKPVIAAIEGHAVAGGLELAAWCDLRVADPDAILGVFCRRFGVPLIDGGTVRLPALIGLSRALDLILTGRPVTANEALAMGLVNRIAPKGQATEEAMKLAQLIASHPQDCMRSDRDAAYHATYSATSFEDAMDYEFRAGSAVLQQAAAGAQRFVKGDGRHGQFKSSL
eukprot:m.82038 g.82038  ORF g.82038 m.82038 type:complete len:275 (-) comp8099_c0_seq2:991-1815(-)